jgi:hypothetical protein
MLASSSLRFDVMTKRLHGHLHVDGDWP